jgi:hypothetical protein
MQAQGAYGGRECATLGASKSAAFIFLICDLQDIRALAINF